MVKVKHNNQLCYSVHINKNLSSGCWYLIDWYPTYRHEVKTRSEMCCHVFHSSEPHLPGKEGFGAATCSTSLAPPPCRGGLRCYHVFRGFRPRFPAEEGSGTVTCYAASNPASLLKRALTLPRVPRIQTCLPAEKGYDAATYLKYKERRIWPSYAARLACSQGART
jgi:hypothetical protein